jgi:hypothetical protein
MNTRTIGDYGDEMRPKSDRIIVINQTKMLKDNTMNRILLFDQKNIYYLR